MNLRIHLFACAALLLFCLVDSSIENSPASSSKVKIQGPYLEYSRILFKENRRDPFFF